MVSIHDSVARIWIFDNNAAEARSGIFPDHVLATCGRSSSHVWAATTEMCHNHDWVASSVRSAKNESGAIWMRSINHVQEAMILRNYSGGLVAKERSMSHRVPEIV